MIDLNVVTPHGRYLVEKVRSIHAKSVMGQFTLLPNHMPVVLSLVPCRLTLVNEEGESADYAISGGILQFADNQARLLTDAIEGRSEIDVPRAQAAYKRARARLEKQSDENQMRRAELALQRAINRLSVTDNRIDD